MALESNMRLARQADLNALFDLDDIAQREEHRRECIAHAVACGQCWVATDADDTALLLGYGVLTPHFSDRISSRSSWCWIRHGAEA